MKHVQKIISYALMGIGLGFLLNWVFSFFYGGYSPGVPSFLEQFSSLSTAVLVEMVLYALLGISSVYAAEIMDREDHSLLSNTVLHFVLVVAPLLVTAYVLHWSTNAVGLMVMGLAIVVVYAIIWIAIYLSVKRQIEQINLEIAHKQ